MHSFVDFLNGFTKGHFNVDHILSEITVLASCFYHFVEANGARGMDHFLWVVGTAREVSVRPTGSRGMHGTVGGFVISGGRVTR